jgi:hypothetical protein
MALKFLYLILLTVYIALILNLDFRLLIDQTIRVAGVLARRSDSIMQYVIGNSWSRQQFGKVIFA